MSRRKPTYAALLLGLAACNNPPPEDAPDEPKGREIIPELSEPMDIYGAPPTDDPIVEPIAKPDPNQPAAAIYGAPPTIDDEVPPPPKEPTKPADKKKTKAGPK